MRSVVEPAECGLCRAGAFHRSVVRHFPARPGAGLLRDSKIFITTPAKTSEMLRWSAESRLSAAVGTSEPASALPQVSISKGLCRLRVITTPDTRVQQILDSNAAL